MLLGWIPIVIRSLPPIRRWRQWGRSKLRKMHFRLSGFVIGVIAAIVDEPREVTESLDLDH